MLFILLRRPFGHCDSSNRLLALRLSVRRYSSSIFEMA
jgi:hypothetical protein